MNDKNEECNTKESCIRIIDKTSMRDKSKRIPYKYLDEQIAFLCEKFYLSQKDIVIKGNNVTSNIYKICLNQSCFDISTRYEKSHIFKNGVRCIQKIIFYSPINPGVTADCKSFSATISVDIRHKGFQYEMLARKLSFLYFRQLIIGQIHDRNYCEADLYLMTEYYDIIHDKKRNLIQFI